MEAAQANWTSGKWSFTATTPETAGSFATSVLSGTGPVTVKASGDESVHISDGQGTIDCLMTEAVFVVKAFKRSGRTVTFTESPFTSTLTFDQTAYNALLAAANTDGAEPVNTATVESMMKNIGEAVAVSTLMKPVYAEKEGGLLAAFMTPEYFWAGVNV